MSLNFELTKIKDYKSVCWTGEGDNARINVVTEMIIFGTMFVGIREITEANAEVFTCRLADWWQSEGPIGEVGDGGKVTWRQVTLEEVKAHIGLKTNASNLTPRQWKAQLTRRRTTEANDRLRAAQRVAAAK